MRRAWTPDWPIDLDLVLGPLTRGPGDPVARRVSRQHWWLTGRTPDGAAALHLQRIGTEVVAHGYGPGGAELLDRLPHLLGDDDDPTGFAPAPGTVVAEQWRRHGTRWRVPCTGLVRQTAVLAILEQKVIGIEARNSWFALCRDHGEPAPDPAPRGMRIAPDREVLAMVPSWWWRANGVDNARAGTVLRLARVRLDAGAADVQARLAAVPGIGPWTLAEVGFRALGDADAVSVGDFHLANLVGYALTGRARSTDEQMLDLLAPYAGHRHRAVRMIELSGVRPPKFGPRASVPTHR
jgi:3-methyladenine DNA glycosylase/8-oxoguanine DNA glycosylase